MYLFVRSNRYNRYETALTAERTVWRCLWCWNSCQKVTGLLYLRLVCSVLFRSIQERQLDTMLIQERKRKDLTPLQVLITRKVSVACKQEAQGSGQRWRCGSCSALLLEGTVKSWCLFQNEEGININTARAIQVILMWTAQSPVWRTAAFFFFSFFLISVWHVSCTIINHY